MFKKNKKLNMLHSNKWNCPFSEGVWIITKREPKRNCHENVFTDNKNIISEYTNKINFMDTRFV